MLLMKFKKKHLKQMSVISCDNNLDVLPQGVVDNTSLYNVDNITIDWENVKMLPNQNVGFLSKKFFKVVGVQKHLFNEQIVDVVVATNFNEESLRKVIFAFGYEVLSIKQEGKNFSIEIDVGG